MSKLKPSLFFLLLSVVFIVSLFHYKSWKWAALIGGDSWGYYAYLPAGIIHHDLDSLDKTVDIRRQYRPESVQQPTPENPLGIGEALPVGNGNYVIKYTMGVAILEAPFFTVAHLFNLVSGAFPTDGYSFPYIFSVHIAGLFYALLGLYLLWKVLRCSFSTNIAFATIGVLALGTNLYYFSVYASLMAHAFLFFLFSLALYATVKWFESPKPVYAALIGASCGMVTLVRPTEIIILLVPVFWGITNWNSIKSRLSFLRQYWRQLMLAIIVFCLMGLPQLIYWKYTTGHFLYYSYGEEGFDFLHPKIWEGLTGYKNGWLAYSPIMWLSILGLFLLWRQAKDWFWPVMAFFPIHVYLIYSWWCWNYINGFGSRPMVEASVLMALPLASFLSVVAKRRWAVAAVSIVAAFFIWLNLFNTWQFSKGLIWTESGKGAFFWRMLGKTQMDYLDLIVYESGEPQPNPDKLRREKIFYSNDFEQVGDTSQTIVDTAYESSRALSLRGSLSNGYTEKVFWSSKMGELGLKGGQWVKIDAQVYSTGRPNRDYEGNFISCKFSRNGKNLKSRKIRLESRPGNFPPSIWGGQPKLWGHAYFWVKTPSRVKADDQLEIIFMNLNGQTVYLDDFSVEKWVGR